MLGVASEDPDSNSDDDIMLPVGPDLAGVPRAVARPPAELPWTGRCGVWLCGVLMPEGSPIAWGVGACQWDVKLTSEEVAQSHAAAPETIGGGGRARGWGYLQYEVQQIWAFDEIVELPNDIVQDQRHSAGHRVREAVADVVSFAEGSMTMADVLHALGMIVAVALWIPSVATFPVSDGVCSVLCRSICLGMRFPSVGILPGCPPVCLLKKLRVKAGGARGNANKFIGPRTKEEWQRECDDEFLRLPRVFEDDADGRPDRHANTASVGR